MRKLGWRQTGILRERETTLWWRESFLVYLLMCDSGDTGVLCAHHGLIVFPHWPMTSRPPLRKKNMKQSVFLCHTHCNICSDIKVTPVSRYTLRHGLLNYIDNKSKMSSSKKLTCKGRCLRPPSLLGFCLGWSSTFVGSESGQIQSVKLLQNIVSNTTQHPPASHCLYVLCFYTG